MSSIVVSGDTSGAVTLSAPAVAGTVTVTLPSASGTMASLASVTANGVSYVNSSGQPTSGSALVFDGSNLGLGVTPSAWQSALRVFQFGSNASIYGNGSNTAFFGLNFYTDSGSTNRYLTSNIASAYGQNSGQHQWYTAASGTAGNAITFTQAMTLDASGNLGIGTTSTTNYILRVNAASPLFGMMVSGTQAFTIGALSGGGGAFYYGAGNAEAMRIDSSGNLLVGAGTAVTRISAGSGQFSTSSGLYIFSGSLSDNSFLSRSSSGSGTTTWYIGNQSITTSSDVRLKENIVDTQRNALELLGQLRVVDHTWNDPSDQCENNRNSRGTWMGLIAQEAQPVIPWLVNKPTADVDENGDPQYWHMDYGYSVPLLVKAIQEQQALITQLQADVAALKGA